MERVLEDIKVYVTNRQWMRAAKAWRVFLEIPEDSILAAQLTALIDSQVNVLLTADDGRQVSMEPAYIVDLTSKGKRFHLVAETVYEHQNDVAPILTIMLNNRVTMQIRNVDDPVATAPAKQLDRDGLLNEKEIQGLHVSFFRNPWFHRYIGFLTESPVHINTPEECKTAFKALLGVASCKDIATADFKRLISEFSTWRNGPGRDSVRSAA